MYSLQKRIESTHHKRRYVINGPEYAALLFLRIFMYLIPQTLPKTLVSLLHFRSLWHKNGGPEHRRQPEDLDWLSGPSQTSTTAFHKFPNKKPKPYKTRPKHEETSVCFSGFPELCRQLRRPSLTLYGLFMVFLNALPFSLRQRVHLGTRPASDGLGFRVFTGIPSVPGGARNFVVEEGFWGLAFGLGVKGWWRLGGEARKA